jgi:cell division protein FtsN
MNTAQDVEPAAPPPANTRSVGNRMAAVQSAPAQADAGTIPEAPAGTGQFFVQIGARNDQAQALAAFNGMQQKYASVLGNYSPSVRKADLGDKGIWYRLRVGPFTDKPGADKLCEDLKTAGWKQCFTVKD